MCKTDPCVTSRCVLTTCVTCGFTTRVCAGLGLDEMRELITMLHPQSSLDHIRKAMLEVRTYCTADGELDRDNFTDALIAVEEHLRVALGADYLPDRNSAIGSISAALRHRRASKMMPSGNSSKGSSSFFSRMTGMSGSKKGTNYTPAQMPQQDVGAVHLTSSADTPVVMAAPIPIPTAQQPV